MNKIFSLGWYNHERSALVLRNHNKLIVCGPFLVPSLLIPNLGPKIQCTPSTRPGQGLVFLSAFYRLESTPSSTCSCDKYACRVPPTYKNYKTATAESVYTFAIDDNCSLCVFLQSDISRTTVRVSYLALHGAMVSMVLAPLLPSNSRILDNDPCHGPSLCILCTTLPRVPPAMVPYPASSSAFPGRDFVVVRGSVELLASDPISVFHATSSPFPMLQLELKASVVTTSSSGGASKTPQTTLGATHLLASY